MKRILLLTMIACLSFSVNAQVSLTTAPDFTVTDIHGDEHNLYSILDGGQHVILDLFGYWCGPCCDVAPQVKQIYEDYGCNTGEVFVISIDDIGTTAQVENFENSCGAADGAPAVSGADGGGGAVVNAYNPAAMPTIIFIAPDRSILDNDIWPNVYSEAAGLLSGVGIQQASCDVMAAAPSASYDYSVDQRTISVTNASTDGDSFEWNFGDGTTSMDENPAPHEYTANGTYSVCVDVTNSVGTDQHCKDVFVEVPTAGFEASEDGLTVTFNNTTIDGGSYTWDFGDGNTSTDADPGTYTYSVAGTYTVCLNAVGGTGDDEICNDVTVADLVGVLNHDALTQFNVHPNPVSSILNVNMILNDVQNAAVNIYSISGKLVHTSTVQTNSSAIKVDMTSFEAGQYILQIATETEVLAYQKIFKQ